MLYASRRGRDQPRCWLHMPCIRLEGAAWPTGPQLPVKSPGPCSCNTLGGTPSPHPPRDRRALHLHPTSSQMLNSSRTHQWIHMHIAVSLNIQEQVECAGSAIAIWNDMGTKIRIHQPPAGCTPPPDLKNELRNLRTMTTDIMPRVRQSTNPPYRCTPCTPCVRSEHRGTRGYIGVPRGYPGVPRVTPRGIPGFTGVARGTPGYPGVYATGYTRGNKEIPCGI
jgi:hypothetical protein